MKHRFVHYGWVILAMGVLIIAASLGLDRYGYAAILPAMQKGLHLSDAQVGVIGSANVFGYLLAAMVAGLLAFRFGPRLIITISLIWMAFGMALLSVVNSFALLTLLRFFTGIAGAGGNISMIGLLSSWFSQSRRGLANGILVGGSGIAIAVTGWFVPAINKLYPINGWRYNWAIIGVIIGILGVLTLITLRNSPGDKDLKPIGNNEKVSIPMEERNEKFTIKDIIGIGEMRMLLLAYFSFGMSYVIYGTFFMNYLVTEKGIAEALAGNIWSTAGILSIGSAIIWGSLSDLIGRRLVLTSIFTLQAISYSLAAAAGINGTLLLWISAVVFGLVAWSVPAVVASYCADLVGPKHTAAAMGIVTVFFGVGQVLGPVSAGLIKEFTNSYVGAFVLAALLALLGAITPILFRTGNKQQHSKAGLFERYKGAS